MANKDEGPAPPAQHHDPSTWWRNIRAQSWIGLFGLIAESCSLIIWGIPDAATAPLTVATVGLVVVTVTYSNWSGLIDAIKAWRTGAGEQESCSHAQRTQRKG